MSDQKDNKVVQFPTHKVRKPKASAGEMVEKSKQSQRWTVALSLLFTVFLASYLSSELNKSSQVVMDKVVERGIASANSVSDRSLEEDISLAKKISRDSLREPASVGRAPTARDNLTHKILHSRYLVEDHGGKVVQILLPDSSNVEPVTMPPREEFFRDFQSILRVPAGKPVLLETKTDEKFKYETYEIKGHDEPSAEVKFIMDRSDRLHQMHVKDKN